jgi:putative flippase GtrA
MPARTTPRLTALLRHPLANQLGRYAIVGLVVATLYISLTLLFSGPVGLPIQVAIPVSYMLAACVHFTLQRHFVFAGHRDTYRLEVRDQARRYVVVNLGQYAITAFGTWALDAAFDLQEQVSYVVSALSVTAFAFVLLRTRIFHSH